MRVVIQRVTQASVAVAGETVGAIGPGYLLLVGIAAGDTEAVLDAMARKIVQMRLFRDPEGDSGFHLSALEVRADILAVSQFTLYADTRKGRRPSFTDAAPPEQAERLFNVFVDYLRRHPLRVETGRFGAMMQVALVNDGPVTICLDSEELKRLKAEG